MRTEVCVVAYESRDTLPSLVASLRLLGEDVGLAVHDNGPGAATLETARMAAAAASVPFRGEACAEGNCGFAKGCNSLGRGSAAADLFFLNPDAQVLSWPASLSADGRVVGGWVVSTDGEQQMTFGTSRTLLDEIRLRWLRRRPRAPRGSGYVSGAALLVSRDLFLQLGGFDEGFFMYYEDIDLCHRAVEAGAAVDYEPGLRVQHLGGHSVGRSAEGLLAAHLRSYQSGRRFHGRRGHSLRGYDLLCAVDAAARAALRSPSRARRPVATADWAVAKTAARRLLATSEGRP